VLAGSAVGGLDTTLWVEVDTSVTSVCADVGVTSAAQAVSKTHNNKTHKFFISISISKKWTDTFMLNLRS
jgi:hypothetical protein